MKKYLIISVLLFGLLVANQVMAQENVEPDITRYYANLNWRDYITQKAFAMYADENDYVLSEEMDNLLEGPEEDDSLFQIQILQYFQITQNCRDVINWVLDYVKQKQIVFDYNQAVELVKDEFEYCLTPEVLNILEKEKK